MRFLTGEVHAEHDVRTPNGEMMESPMRWMRIQGDGETTYTDEDGVWALDGEDAPSGDLVGQYVRIRNEGGPNADIEGLTEDMLLTADDADQAELSAFVFQSQIRQWATVYAPEIPLTDTRINVYVTRHTQRVLRRQHQLHAVRRRLQEHGRIADVNYREWGHGFRYYSLLSESLTARCRGHRGCGVHTEPATPSSRPASSTAATPSASSRPTGSTRTTS